MNSIFILNKPFSFLLFLYGRLANENVDMQLYKIVKLRCIFCTLSPSSLPASWFFSLPSVMALLHLLLFQTNGGVMCNSTIVVEFHIISSAIGYLDV